MKKVLLLIFGVVSLMLIAAACGGDADKGPAQRAEGTTSAVATTAPPVATATSAPIPTEAPPAETTAPVAATAPPTASDSGNGGGSAAIERGQAIFNLAGCVACHTIEGIPGVQGQIGPELTHIATVGGTRISGLPAEEYIRQSINDPPSFVVDGFSPIMPPTIRSAITDEAMEDLIAFLLVQE